MHALLSGATGALAFTLSWLCVQAVRTLALRRGLLDVPNERSSHLRPTPRLGGIGILVAIVTATSVGAGLAGWFTQDLVVVLALATAVSLVSLRDDLHGLPPLGRLVVHLTTATLAVAWLGPLHLPVPGLSEGTPVSGLVAQAITVIWIAGFINAFNFMDGTDGIAAVQALIAGAAWAVAAWWAPDPGLVVLATAVTAASAGFLLHNWSPATIFMGDVGSALLGFLLAVLPLLAEPPASLPIAVLPVWPFVFDTSLTLVRRAVQGENVLAAHRSHLYQRLAQGGWRHAQIALLYGGLSLVGAALAVLMATGLPGSNLGALVLVVAGPLLLWRLVATTEANRRHQSRGAPTMGRQDRA